MKAKPALSIDPFFNDVPWEIIYDDTGRIIGEVFKVTDEKRPEYPRERKASKERTA